MTAVSAQAFAARHWYRRTALSTLLLPLAAVFSLAVWLRRCLYRVGCLPAARLPVPVLVVGNLTVGGTGKTPLVIWIAQLLRRAGLSPGIVLRGYAGGATQVRAVVADSSPQLVGDEAVLLAERTACPVWVGPNRAAAARALLQAHPRCDVLLCDDGLQHYQIARDFEVAVEDERGHGNGRRLPAGPLREAARRRVDVTVVNAVDEQALPARNSVVLRMKVVPGALRRIGRAVALDTDVGMENLKHKRLHAVAGIGNPPRFFAMLRAMGLAATEHPFPDHHRYTGADLDFPECDAILMTEKDAVKCRSLGGHALIAVSIDVDPDPRLAELILKAVAMHASQAANFQENRS